MRVDVEALERKLEKNPRSFSLRKKLIDSFALEFPSNLRFQKYILDAIAQHPREKADWNIWAAHFLMSESNKRKAIALWKKAIRNSRENSKIVLNSANFSCVLDSKFSSKCFYKLMKKNPKDLNAFEGYIRTLFWSGESEKAFKLFKKRMQLTPEIDPIDMSTAIFCAIEAGHKSEANKWKKTLKDRIKKDKFMRDRVKPLFRQRKLKF